jgi:aspartyl-tRNA(Asn)/glutamyl-tRNA(Gln) amidotransferase subunit A
VVEVKARGFELMPQVGLTIMAAEASVVHRRLIRNHTAEYDQATRIQLEVGELVPATHYLLAQRARTLLRDSVRKLFGEHGLDALLWPTLATTTVPLTELFSLRGDLPSESPMLGYIHQTFSANVLGQPALSIPCGVSDDGLPIGVQLLGRPFAEAPLFRLARAYERATSWSTLQPPLPV